MSDHEKVLNFIEEVNASNPIMKEIFLFGACFNFYFILKCIFPDAKPIYERVLGHVVTEINGKLYDISGEVQRNKNHKFIGDIWGEGSSYNDESTYKNGEMYILSNKTKYIRDIRNWSGFVSTCHDAKLIITINKDKGFYICKECGQPCEIK